MKPDKPAGRGRHLLLDPNARVTCPDCGKQILVFGPSQAMQTASRLGVPLLGQLPLDAELACRCDAGEIEAYKAACFAPIVKPLLDRMRIVCPQ